MFQRRDQVVRQVRVGLVQHVIDAGLDQRKGFRAWKDVEAVICDRFESDFGNFIGRDGAVLHRLLGSCPGGELGFGQRRCIQQMCRAVPIGVTNFRRHIRWTQHRRAQLWRHQLQVVPQAFGQSHHRVFGNAVNPHPWGREQTGHGRRVDDAALVGGIGGGRGDHPGREAANAVDDPLEIDT